MLVGGRYRLVERIGEGGMSVVWRGRDEVLGRAVAVKVLTPQADRGLADRLRVEAQAAARLCHPNIAAVYDYGESPDPYVVMELVDGESLAARLVDGGLPWQEAAVACAQVAAALADAHAHGIVHRDVTPANVMLTSGGAKVVDFGISALAGSPDADLDGSLFGTPAYLAPERLDGGPVEPATDVYGLGLLLYKSLAGRLPWPAMTITQMLKAHRQAEPAPLPIPVAAEVPPEVVEVCRRCLAKRPGDRPASAEVAERLAQAVNLTVPVPSSPAPPGHSDPVNETTVSMKMPRRRRHAIIVLAGLVLIAIAAWAGVQDPPPSPGPAQALGPVAPPAQTSPEHRCRVDYQVREDWGSGFTARLAVTNQGPAALRDWRLVFAFPGNQQVTAARQATWTQSGRTVVTRPAASTSRLDAGDTAEIALTASYVSTNRLPESFALDGTTCQTVVLAPAALRATPSSEATPSPEKDNSGKGKANGKSKKGKG